MTVNVITSTADRTEDTIAGASSYILARAGNQTLVGNDGGDTYVFDWARMSRDPATVMRAVQENGTDAGVDTILINGRPSTNAKIIFDGTKYFLLLLNGNNQISSSDRRIELVGFDPLATGNVGIERIQFLNNGVLETWDRAAMLASLQTGTASGDSLIGTAGDDIRNGGAGNDTITGGSGFDLLTGGTGNDSLDGGADGDTYFYSAGNDGTDMISDTGTTGVDVLNMLGVSASNARISFNATGQLVLQTRATATGAWSDAVVLGNTVLGNSAAGIEEIRFGSTVWTRADMRASAFDRTDDNRPARIIGTEAAERITGGTVADTVSGGAGNDTLFGGAGADSLLGEADADSIVGGADADRLFGGTGADTLVGGAGNDSLVGGEDGDVYSYVVGEGLDTLSDTGTTGTDVLELSGVAAGNIRIVLNASNQYVVQLRTSATAAWSDAVVLVDTNILGDAAAGIEQIRLVDSNLVWNRADMRTSFFDRSASTTAVTVNGTAVQDTIRGGAANDTLNGGAGDDFLVGNAGNDLIDGGEGADRVVWSFRSSSTTWNATSGNDGDDTIRDTGAAGADVLELRGIDPARVRIATRTEGTQTYYVLEIVNSFAGADTAPTVLRTIHLRDNLLNATSAGTGVETVEFRSLDGATLLLSLSRADLVALQAATLRSGTTAGQATVLGDGADFYDGGSGNDRLSGDAGWDRLEGGAGNDTISGGVGRDTFVFTKGATDRDTIADFNLVDDFFALDGFTQAEWDAAVAGAVVADGNVTLTFDAATSITLQNVTGIATVDDLRKISVTFS